MFHLCLAALTIVTAPDTGKTISFVADAGLVSTGGNTDVTSFSLGDKLGIRLGSWTIGQIFALAYVRNNDSVTASAWHAAVRGDRSLSPHVALFALNELERNRFAGVRSRISPSLGVSAAVVHDSLNELKLEAGAGYTWLNAVVPNPDREYAAGRAALAYHRKLGMHSGFDQTIEVLPDFKNSNDIRINSETALTAPISTRIALKVTFGVRYSGLPEPGFRKTDRVLTSGVQVTF